MAENGKKGIEKVFEVQPDITLMDIHMPVMDGYEATKTLRKMGYNGLIVAFTASVKNHETNKSIDAVFDYFLTKSINKQFENRLKEIQEEHF